MSRTMTWPGGRCTTTAVLTYPLTRFLHVQREAGCGGPLCGLEADA